MINFSSFLLIVTVPQLKFYGALFLIVLSCITIIERLRDLSKSVNVVDDGNSEKDKDDEKELNSLWWNLGSIIGSLIVLKYMGDYILSVIQDTM